MKERQILFSAPMILAIRAGPENPDPAAKA